MTEDEAKAWLAARYPVESVDRLQAFVHLLLAESQRQNLISASTFETVWSRHIVDSAQLLDHLPAGQEGPWLDIGSGAGLPGIIAGILEPQRRIVLVEPRKRRVAWLLAAVEALALERTEVVGRKIAQVEPFPAAVISARAVMGLAPLVHAASAFSTRETIWLLPKGASARQELTQLYAKERVMFHVEQSVTDPAAKIIVGRGAISGLHA